MRRQKTLAREVQFSGIGLHSGAALECVIAPAPVDHGIVFRRVDLEPAVELSAQHHWVVDTQLATTLGRGSVTVSTVEHILSALSGAGVTNAVVRVNGSEIPVMDGSASAFHAGLLEVGIVEQAAPQAFWVIQKKLELQIGEKWVTVEPADHFSIHGSIEWDHPCIGYQEMTYEAGVTPYEELCAARTFGFLHEVSALQSRGLARGGSLENAVVLDRALVLNPEGLRYRDEFIRHKLLDAIGDLALAGLPILGHFRLHRAGHDLHHQLLQMIFSQPNAVHRMPELRSTFPAENLIRRTLIKNEREPRSHLGAARTLVSSF